MTLDELSENLQEVLELLAEDGEPQADGQFIGTQILTIETAERHHGKITRS